MFDTLKKNFSQYPSSPFSGKDGKFHTVYAIVFESGHFYIGKHTSSDLSNDPYLCSSRLVKKLVMNKSNIYEKRNLFFFESSNQAILAETKILQNKKYFDNEYCLNCYPGSPPDLTGHVIISKGSKFKMVNPKLLELYLEKGWERKGVKRIWVTDGEKSKFILPEEIEDFLDNGWVLGSAVAKDRTFVKRDGALRFIKYSDLDFYLSEGWAKCHNVTGRTVLRKGDHIIKVREEDIDIKIKEGYVKSSTVSGLVWVSAPNGDLKRVKEDELREYVEKGWVNRSNTFGKIYINNGVLEKRIERSEIENYPEFKEGRIKKIYMNDGKVEKRVYHTDTEIIENLQKRGFVIGHLNRKGAKVRIYRNSEYKNIRKEFIQKYIEEGWTEFYDPKVHKTPRTPTSKDD